MGAHFIYFPRSRQIMLDGFFEYRWDESGIGDFAVTEQAQREVEADGWAV